MFYPTIRRWSFPGSVVLAVLCAGILVFGCNNSSNPPPPSSGGGSSHFHTVNVQNMAFSPSALTIAVGDTVSWTNGDAVAHTVTSNTGNELSGSLSPAANYQHIFAAAGNYPYHCAIHPTMTGAVTVQ